MNQDATCVLIVAHVSASLKRLHTDVLLNFIAAITLTVLLSVGESGGGHGGTCFPCIDGAFIHTNYSCISQDTDTHTRIILGNLYLSGSIYNLENKIARNSCRKWMEEIFSLLCHQCCVPHIHIVTLCSNCCIVLVQKDFNGPFT